MRSNPKLNPFLLQCRSKTETYTYFPRQSPRYCTGLQKPTPEAKSQQGVGMRTRGLHYISWGIGLAQRSVFWDVLSPCGTQGKAVPPSCKGHNRAAGAGTKGWRKPRNGISYGRGEDKFSHLWKTDFLVDLGEISCLRPVLRGSRQMWSVPSCFISKAKTKNIFQSSTIKTACLFLYRKQFLL